MLKFRRVLPVCAAIIALASGPALSGVPGPEPEVGSVFHGVGCRKSSPPGQCCHMETKTGRVHCH